MSDKRAAIIELYRAGKTNSEILKLLKAPRSTVYHTISRCKELQSTEDRPRSGRPRSSRTPKMINAVRARIRRNPKRSMRAMARDMNVSEKTIRNIVKTDLKMSSFKMQTRQHLTDLQKKKRLARAKILLNKLKAGTDTSEARTKILLNKLKAGTDTSEIIFSDEKLFTVEAICNRQNNRVLAKSSADIPDSTRSVFRRQKSSSVMVWAAISQTWKSPLIFVPQGAKVNTKAYIETILTPALQAAKKHFKDKPFIFQQHGAPSHTSKKTQKWCQDHFPGFWSKEAWPPSSPDLNPMDFSVWSLLEADACASSHVSVGALKSSLEKAWAKIPQETLRKAPEGFRGRLERVIQARGAHIE